MINRFRSDIVAMKAYSSARSLYEGSDDHVFLDANECSYEPYIGAFDLAGYPAAQPKQLMDLLCRLYDVASQNLVITRGADEAIDIIIRSICIPQQDNIIICPPTFPMYEQAAILQAATIIKVPLTNDFQLDIASIKSKANDNTKIVFLCSPNNPTGNLLNANDMIDLCTCFADKAFIVVDETYIEYASCQSLSNKIHEFPNLIILRTLSKAYAAAGLRCGCAIASSTIITMLKKVLAPYPIPKPVITETVRILENNNQKRLHAKRLETERTKSFFIENIGRLDEVETIYPSDANFILVKVKDADDFCQRAMKGGYILRNQTHSLKNCVRITIGSFDDMAGLLGALNGDVQIKPIERKAVINRITKETSITVKLNLDKSSPINIQTGIGFYDHMLEQIAKHAGISIIIECAGDLYIDVHHTIEDVSIALGQAIKTALGDKRGVERYGFTLPMDEAQATCVLDLSGRFYLDFEGIFPRELVGEMPTDMVKHVFYSLAENLGANLHMIVTGDNAHHMVEACFKAFGRALKQAIQKQGDELPSSKGVL